MSSHSFRAGALLGLAIGLAGCTSSSGSGGGAGTTLGNMLRYGSTTEPPVASAPVFEAADCPGVTVSDGGAALRRGTSQVSIANVARECIERPNGAIAVKVGVEGRALLGPGGGAGRFDVPVAFAIKSGDRVLVSRVKRVSVTVPAGAAQGSFLAVESEMIVPPGTGEFDIEVGLSGSAAGSARRRGG